MTKKRKIILALIVLVAVSAGVYFWQTNQNDSGVARIINEVPKQAEDDQTSDEQTEQGKPENTDADAEPQKTTSPPSGTAVTEPPLVYTGYGHSQDDPLKLNQETSTTCTTVAGADCYIDFKDSNGKTAKLASKKTDSQGIAVWNWQGDEVGSGTWSVTAVAGGKISSIETIYIQ